jgi:hypothetical protein
VEGAWSLAWISYIGFGFLIAVVRKEAREFLCIPGWEPFEVVSLEDRV